MDAVFDQGYEKHYYTAREYVFQQDKKGGKVFWNRAGDKLYEIHMEVDLWGNLPAAQGRAQKTVFLDICGGPGAFSQVLLSKTPEHTRGCPVNGYWVTLRWEGMSKDDQWYQTLWKHPSFVTLFGADDTGACVTNVWV